MSLSAPHAAIAGAGLAGRLVAWRLARAGWRVSLFDARSRSDTRSASHVAAAMLSPLAERASADDAVFALGQQSMDLWPGWIDELQADSGRSVYFRREGTLVVAHAADAGTRAQFEGRLRHGLTPSQLSPLKALDASALAVLEPALAGRFTQGLLLEGEGQLANDELLLALETVLTRAPHVWHERCEVLSVKARRIAHAQGVCEADLVVDTRGLGALPDWPGLRGVRGEVITVACEAVSLRRPVRLMHPRYPLYVVPRRQHRFVIGATELESQDDGPITLRSVLELGSALYSLHPGFGEARVLSTSASLRPAFDNHRPVLRCQRGVWQLNGLFRHGYLCAPALVASLVGQLEQPAPLEVM
ncbi:MAG: hypothetical protein RLZZ618_1964 [Pseudomonadota bacterium]